MPVWAENQALTESCLNREQTNEPQAEMIHLRLEPSVPSLVKGKTRKIETWNKTDFEPKVCTFMRNLTKLVKIGTLRRNLGTMNYK
jgi:hypothetical protein